jgi:hypothetical protein
MKKTEGRKSRDTVPFITPEKPEPQGVREQLLLFAAIFYSLLLPLLPANQLAIHASLLENADRGATVVLASQSHS